jgi:hypothetical protein
MSKHLLFFKNLLILLPLIFSQLLFAQIQQIPLGTSSVFNYSVDTSSDTNQPELNDQPSGSIGSTYNWTINTSLARFPTGNLNDILTDNKASIDWSLVTPGIYQIQVEENNANCPTEIAVFTVEITIPLATAYVDWSESNICKGNDVLFEITNALPNSILYYTVTNSTTPTGSILIDSTGNAQIILTHDGSTANEVKITLEKLVINDIDLIFNTPKPTKSAPINIINTSPILILP